MSYKINCAMFPATLKQKSWDLENKSELNELTKIVNEIPKPAKKYPWTLFNGRFYYSNPKGKIIACDFLTGKTITKFEGHRAPLCKLYFNEQNLLISESTDGEVNIWRMNGDWLYSNYT